LGTERTLQPLAKGLSRQQLPLPLGFLPQGYCGSATAVLVATIKATAVAERLRNMTGDMMKPRGEPAMTYDVVNI
jgi:hypothetical protein